MKKITLIIGLAIVYSAVLGQAKNVNKANSSLSAGNLAEALEFIEPAISFEKTMGKGKTWYTRAQIFDRIAVSEEESVKSLDADALPKAVESYYKVLELENESSTYYNLANLALDALYQHYANVGVASYEAQDYPEALIQFENLATIKPSDTTAYIYAGTVAHQDENYDAALKHYYKVVELDHHTLSVYNSIIGIEMAIKENYDKAMEVLVIAKEKFPEDIDLKKIEIDLLIKTEQVEEAIASLDKAIQLEPSNGNLHYNMAFLLGETGKKEESTAAYLNGIEMAPDYIPLYYNLAFTYIEEGNILIKEANDMDIKKYQKEGGKLEEEARANYGKALPFLDKANEIEPNDTATLQTMEEILIKLKRFDDAEAIHQQRVKLGHVEPDNE